MFAYGIASKVQARLDVVSWVQVEWMSDSSTMTILRSSILLQYVHELKCELQGVV